MELYLTIIFLAIPCLLLLWLLATIGLVVTKAALAVFEAIFGGRKR